MSRVAVGDLLVDLEAPDHFNVGYEESGALVVWDDGGMMAIRVSGITISGKDPNATNLCVASCKNHAREKGVPFFELSSSLGYYEETSNSDWTEGPGVNEFIYTGFGNRTFVFTLSYLESDRERIPLPELRNTMRSMVQSLALTHPLAKKAPILASISRRPRDFGSSITAPIWQRESTNLSALKAISSLFPSSTSIGVALFQRLRRMVEPLSTVW